MFCWHCGTKLPGAAAFCYRCGQSQAPDATFDPTARGIAPDGWTRTRRPADADELTEPVAHAAPTPAAIGPAVPTKPLPADSPATAQLHPIGSLLAIVCGIAVIAGSLGPWVTAHIRFSGPFEIRGSEVDGRITVWCGVVAIACVLLLLIAPKRPGLLVTLAALAFLSAAVIGASDWTSVTESLRELRASGWAAEIGLLRAEIGWGLRAVTFGGAGGTILALGHILHSRAMRLARGGSR